MIPINRQRAIDDFILFTTPQPFDTRPMASPVKTGFTGTTLAVSHVDPKTGKHPPGDVPSEEAAKQITQEG